MRNVLYIVIAVLALAAVGGGYLYVRFGHIAYLPIPVLADDEYVRTEIYLEVTHARLDLPIGRFLESSEPINAPFITLVNTITGGNVREVRQLIHPQVFQSQEPANVTNFIRGLIENYPAAQDLTVERRFEVGEEVVFVLTGRLGTIPTSAAMRFSSADFDVPRYVPFGMDSPAIRLIVAWSSSRRRARNEYAAREFPGSLLLGAGLAYRVPLSERGEQSYLAFDGKAMTGQDPSDDPVHTLLRELASAAARRDWPGLLARHTAGSRAYLERAFPSRAEPDYANFVARLSKLVPLFYIDGGELFVVFSGYEDRGALYEAGIVTEAMVLNYITSKSGAFRVANAGILPLSYHVFTDAHVLRGVRMDPPFIDMKSN